MTSNTKLPDSTPNIGLLFPLMVAGYMAAFVCLLVVAAVCWCFYGLYSVCRRLLNNHVDTVLTFLLFVYEK